MSPDKQDKKDEKDKQDKKKADEAKAVKGPPALKTSLHSLSKQTVSDPSQEQSAGRRGGQQARSGGKGGGRRPGGRDGRGARGGKGKRSGARGPGKPIDQQEVKNPPTASLGDTISPEMAEELKKRGLLK